MKLLFLLCLVTDHSLVAAVVVAPRLSVAVAPSAAAAAPTTDLEKAAGAELQDLVSLALAEGLISEHDRTILGIGGDKDGRPTLVGSSFAVHTGPANVTDISALLPDVEEVNQLLRRGTPDMKGLDIMTKTIEGLQKTITDTHAAIQKRLNEWSKHVGEVCSSSAHSRKLKASFEEGVANHKKCRAKQLQDRMSLQACNQVIEGLFELQETACEAEELEEEPDPEICKPSSSVSDWGSWLKANMDTFKKKLAELRKFRTDCEEATAKLQTTSCEKEDTALRAKEDECELTLDNLETAGCGWAAAKRHACTSYDGCYEEQRGKYDEFKKTTKEQEVDRKLQWRMTSRFKCLFDTRSGEPGVSTKKLDACMAHGVYKTDHLDLTYPPYPPPSVCPPPSIYPGSDLYKDMVYEGIPENIDVRPPVKCPAAPKAQANAGGGGSSNKDIGSGELLVLDAYNGRLQECPLSGEGDCKTLASGFNKPSSFIIDADTYLVADTKNKQVQRCGNDGSCKVVYGGASSGIMPTGIAKTKNGNYLVADASWQNLVAKCRPGGEDGLWECAKIAGGFAGRAEHALSSPADVTTANDGDYIVTDRRNNRIQKCPHTDPGEDFFSREGKREQAKKRINCYTVAGGAYGSATNQLKTPRGVTVTDDGNILVADSKNHRILSCKPIAKGADVDCFIVAGGKKGKGKDQFNQPWGVAMAPDGFLIVADSYNHRVQKCSMGTPDKIGECFTLVGSAGSGSGKNQLNKPFAVAVR